MEITALNKTQLIEVLRQTDISVPPRGPERTNDHVERSSMARVLATLADSDVLVYPLSTRKNERPDYVVSQDSNFSGFEITEAINPQYIQAQSLPEAKKDENIVDVGHFKWGKRHNLEQLRNISSRTRLTAPPRMGNAVEREYAEMICDVINKKTITLDKDGFSKYAENNLIIYVNQMLPILESTEATDLCNEKLLNYWSEASFDNVYVECYSELHHYSERGVIMLPPKNLWQ
jgi:hypothetical protein